MVSAIYQRLSDPNFMLMILVAVSAAATVLTIALPLLEGDRLNSRMKAVSTERDRIIDAMHEFYAADTHMQENGNPPTIGLQANIVREQRFLDSVAQWKAFEVGAIAASGDTTFYEYACHEGNYSMTNILLAGREGDKREAAKTKKPAKAKKSK